MTPTNSRWITISIWKFTVGVLLFVAVFVAGFVAVVWAIDDYASPPVSQRFVVSR